MREIFDRDTERGESIADIVRTLPAKGLLTRTGKQVPDRSTVWAMLRNPARRGQAAFGKTQTTGRRAKPSHPVATAVSATAAARPDAMSRPSSGPASPSPRYRRGDLRARPGAPTGEQALRQAQQQRARAAEGILVCRDCGYACWRTSARTTKRRLYSYRCIGSDNCRHVACVEPADPRRRTRRARVGRSRAAPVRPTLIRAEIERRLRPLRTESPATHRRDGLERELVRVKNVGEPCAGEPHARIDGGGRKPAPVGASPRGARRLSPTRPTSQFRFAWRSRIVDALVPIGHRRGTRCCYLRAAASRGATGGRDLVHGWGAQATGEGRPGHDMAFANGLT